MGLTKRIMQTTAGMTSNHPSTINEATNEDFADNYGTEEDNEDEMEEGEEDLAAAHAAMRAKNESNLSQMNADKAALKKDIKKRRQM